MIASDLLSMSRYAEAAQAAAHAIAENGYASVTNFVRDPALTGLLDEFERLYLLGAFRRAGVGAGSDFRTGDDIRGDEIFWIEPAQASPPLREVLSAFEALRAAVNRVLYLGLFDLECHLAQFAPGTGYHRHYDQFRSDALRQLTVTLYLNANWRGTDGGTLRLYLDDADATRFVDIVPEGGSMIAFLSARFAHEVLPCTRQRRSLTGWFKRRG